MAAKRTAAGFTLIELMIVVAVIAILAAIAFNMYNDSIRKTRTGQMKEGVMQITTALDGYQATANKYPSTMPAGTYTDMISYTYTPAPDADNATGYAVTATEATSRFHIWVGINSRGVRCFCSGGSCSAPSSFTAATVECSGSVTAF